MAGPLAGLKVVEMVGIGPCPFAAMMLSDMGADVIRVDRPRAPDAGSPFAMLGKKYDVLARGRKSLALDLKDPAARDLVLDLAGRADILLEGYRPGVMERLGLGPDECHARNPRLVYGRVTGWGQHGPLAHTAGHDIDYIALSGVLHAMGRADAPPAPPLNLLGDFGAGAMMLAFGVVCAVLEAQRSGKGQVVDAAMTDGAALLGAMVYGMHGSGDWATRREANLLDGGAHFYDTYACRDGKFIAVGAIEPQFYVQLMRLAGIDDPAFDAQMDRAAWPDLKHKLAAVLRQRTRDEWCKLLEGSDTCVAPVLDVEEAPRHPHNRARGTFIEIDGVVQPAPAPRFSRTPPGVPHGPMRAGEHGAGLLRSWGIDEAQVTRLFGAGVSP